MSYKLCYLQFLLLFCLVVTGCVVLSGCSDDLAQVNSNADNVPAKKSVNMVGQDQYGLPEEGVLKTVGNKVDNAQASELYAGWEKPQDVLVFTGRQFGYVEPCGCTGLELQKGGLARRHSFVLGLRDRGWNVVAVDSGNQVRRFGRQPELKFNLTAELLATME